MKQVLSCCPVCESELAITRLACNSCGTAIEGSFSPSPFMELKREDMEFLILFLKTWGNLSETAKILGISYPTVRARFESFLKKVRIKPDASPDISEILDLLGQGELTADQAQKQIKRLKQGR